MIFELAKPIKEGLMKGHMTDSYWVEGDFAVCYRVTSLATDTEKESVTAFDFPLDMHLCYISSIQTAEAKRGRGIGTVGLKNFIEFVQKEYPTVKNITLSACFCNESELDNDATMVEGMNKLVKFYERMGFNGGWEDGYECLYSCTVEDMYFDMAQLEKVQLLQVKEVI